MTTEDSINYLIAETKCNTGKIRDGYHSFEELYEHRIILFICLCVYLYKTKEVWRSKYHSDGSTYEGWFIMGINTEKGKQISYHLPIRHWTNTMFAKTLDKAPEFDGHTSNDVIERLKQLD